MPKESKHSRGRREEKKLKRKREKGEDESNGSKRQKSEEEEEQEVEFIGLDKPEVPEDGDREEAAERPFYGMLEDEEQEYFRRADELLELNDFPSPEERDLFLANVYREAEGKELKIACSQSCSRLMERLILLSNVEQKKKLFGKFSGNFAHLVQHRFASHCCETLFIQSAPIVTQELTADSKKGEGVEMKDGEVYVSMENLFLFTLNELEGQMTFLLTDRFASHTLRVLLVILSGRSMEITSTRSLLQSKRKETIAINGISTAPTGLSLTKRAVPESFHYAVEKIISDTIATMDQSFIHILATHPTGNPSLQLLLELELTNPSSKKGSNSEKTIISALLPDDISTEGSESSTFINGILYDAIGSRLLETIMIYAPGKLFKQIYRSTFRDRIAALARNEISSYVVLRVLQRISKEDLEDAVANIVPQATGLIQRSRTVVVKTLLERCHARGAEKSIEALTSAIAAAYGDDTSTLILKMACIDGIDSFITSALPITSTSEEGAGTTASPQPLKPTPSQTHGSLLAQSMLSLPGSPSTVLQTSLLSLPPKTLLALALYNTTSHIIQAALTTSPSQSSGSSSSQNETNFRRKVLNTLLFPLSAQDQDLTSPTMILALSSTGSHTLDSILLSSSTLFSLIERVAITLSTHESTLRESFTGRIVWRNWSMDLFKRRRGEWVRKVKEATPQSSPAEIKTSVLAGKDFHVEDANERVQANARGRGRGEKKVDIKVSGKAEIQRQKTGIELAREKFALQKRKKEMMKSTKGTGANTISA
jgi:nucleolar protein 9